jgi:hypothetical protein
MKQTPIVAPAKRTEGSIIDDIALESGRLGAAQQALAGLEDRRAAMFADGAGLDEVHGLADSLARARLKIEIAESRLGGWNQELKRFYAAEAQAALDAEMAPLAAIADEERATVRSYEEHAAAVSADLAKLMELDVRRHRVSVAVHRLNGQWVSADSPIRRGPITSQVKLPSATGDKDFWPPQSAAMLEVHARAARDAAALLEYRESE